MSIDRSVANPEETLSVATAVVDISDNNFNCKQIPQYTRYINETEGENILFTIGGRPVACSPNCQMYNPGLVAWEPVRWSAKHENTQQKCIACFVLSNFDVDT